MGYEMTKGVMVKVHHDSIMSIDMEVFEGLKRFKMRVMFCLTSGGIRNYEGLTEWNVVREICYVLCGMAAE